MDIAQVKDIMTDRVVTVPPDMPILQVADLIIENNFNGMPVVDAQKKLLGLVTEFNLLSKASILKIPDAESAAKEYSRMKSLTAADCMETKPFTLLFDDTFENALKLFSTHHRVNPVPVVDHSNTLVGVVSRYDLLKLLKLYGHS